MHKLNELLLASVFAAGWIIACGGAESRDSSGDNGASTDTSTSDTGAGNTSTGSAGTGNTGAGNTGGGGGALATGGAMNSSAGGAGGKPPAACLSDLNAVLSKAWLCIQGIV
jgi:hypothetical protein